MPDCKPLNPLYGYLRDDFLTIARINIRRVKIRFRLADYISGDRNKELGIKFKPRLPQPMKLFTQYWVYSFKPGRSLSAMPRVCFYLHLLADTWPNVIHRIRSSFFLQYLLSCLPPTRCLLQARFWLPLKCSGNLLTAFEAICSPFPSRSTKFSIHWTIFLRVLRVATCCNALFLHCLASSSG